MSSDTDGLALSVRELGKSYEIVSGAASGNKTIMESILQRMRRPFDQPKRSTFWAARDINFDIRCGEVVGLVGRNGAGKSTLLKLLARITPPTTGRIDIWGRVGSLLEVGTGFHPELTGRENIFMNGAVLGMSRAEIQRQFDDIVEFAEVSKFLDTPVKRYSSGMYVRLAFAVAAHLNPEILIVDEVLAVGDAAFQKKCLGKMNDVARGDGRTVLFVSHNIAAVRSLCSRALLLDRGSVLMDGPPDLVLARYSSETSNSASNTARWSRKDSNAPDFHFVEARAYAVEDEMSPYLFDSHDLPMPLTCASAFEIAITFEIEGTKPLTNLQIGLTLLTDEGTVVCGSHDPSWSEAIQLAPGRYVSHCRFPAFCLNEGIFHARFFADIPHERRLQITDYDLKLVIDDSEGYGVNSEKLPGILRPRLTWNRNSLAPSDVALAK